MNDPAVGLEWIENLIEEFILNSPANTLKAFNEEKAFDQPLIGFSQGDDPIYESYKEHIGPFHFTPLEIFSLNFLDTPVRAQDLTVISWILPQTEATRKDNRKMDRFPAERWARARIMGEEVNVKLRRHVVEALREKGVSALAPQLAPQWEIKGSEKFTIASTWSERHAAHAGGLGTFGLCDGLITARGKAHRVGSVIARVKIPATPRPYTNHREYCLFFSKGACLKCIGRCPVGALSEKGHDKLKCLGHLKPGTADYVKENYGFDGYGCGLCQTGVPCESKIPVPGVDDRE
ncbi:MAG: epoxyqueuosine reductase [Pseudomonadota bacterium]